MLIDTHCHLDYIEAGLCGHDPGVDLADILERSCQNGVGAWINPGVTPKDFARILKITERFEHAYAALAIHPTDVEDVKNNPNWLTELGALLSHPKVIAVGETGLDYYHCKAEEADFQRECFYNTLLLAKKHQLPVIIHDREAHHDIKFYVDKVPGTTGVMHCFSGDALFAKEMIERNFYISFAGNVTFKKAESLREAAKSVPLDRLLVETDSPFLSPMPERGKPNEPYRTRFVAECLAEVLGMPVEKLAKITTENAQRLFKIVLPN